MGVAIICPPSRGREGKTYQTTTIPTAYHIFTLTIISEMAHTTFPDDDDAVVITIRGGV
jgi:hypothetical protein